MADSLIVRVRTDTTGVEESLGRVESKLDSLQATGKSATGPVEKGLSDTAAAGRRAEDAVGGLGSTLSTLIAGGAVGTGLNMMVDRLGQMAKVLLDSQVQAERLAIGMQFAVGSAGAEELKYVAQVANTLGLELNGTASAYMKFAAAARGTKLEGQATRDVFEAVARAAAVMGTSAQDTEGVLRALQQMISKGTVQSEELRGQLGERLPGAFQIAARAMGVTTAELGKMLEQGQVISDEFLPKFARQLDKELGENVEKASQRTEASVNRLSNAWETLKQTAAQSGVGSFISGQLDVLRDGLNNVTERMKAAKDEGGGFFAQLGAGAVGVAQFLNPLNAFVYTVQSSEERLKAARIEVVELKAALEKQPNNLLLKEALRDTERLVDELEKAKNAMRSVVGGVDGRQGSADSQAARMYAQQLKEAGDAAAAVMQKLSGTSKEFYANLEVLHREYELGGVSLEEYRKRVALLINAQGNGKAMVAELDRANKEARKNEADASREAQRLADAEAKAIADLNRERVAYGATLAKSVQSLDEEVRKARESLLEMGLTKQALNDLRMIRLQERVAAEEAKLAAFELDEAERRAIEMKIAKLRELIDIERERAGKEAEVERAKAAEDAWKHAGDSISTSLTDALMRGFESGKGFLENLVDTAKNLFNSLVLRPVIQPVVQSMVGGLFGTYASGASAAAGGAQFMSGLGNIFSGASSIGTLGNLFGVGTAAGNFMGGVGGTLAGIFGEAGVGGTLSAGFQALGAGNIMGGLGSLAPYAAAAYGLYRLISGVGTGRQRSPAQQDYETLFGSTLRAPNVYPTPNTAGPGGGGTNEFLRGIIFAVSGAASALGGAYNPGTGYGVMVSSSPDGLGAQTVGDVWSSGRGGLSLYQRNVNGANDTVGQRLEAMVPGMILAGLQDSSLPARISEYFNAASAASIDQATLDSMIATASAAHTMATAFANLGGPFSQLNDLSVEARSGLLALTGGLDQFVSKVNSYVANFYTEDQQAALTASSIAAALTAVGINVDGLDTKDEFVALVNSLDVGTETGRQQLAALLNVNQAFAGLVEYMQQTGQDLGTLAKQSPQDAIVQLSSQQANETAQIVTGLDSVVTAVDNVGTVVANAVTAAVAAIGNNPVIVNVTVTPQEVNGGVA